MDIRFNKKLCPDILMTGFFRIKIQPHKSVVLPDKRCVPFQHAVNRMKLVSFFYTGSINNPIPVFFRNQKRSRIPFYNGKRSFRFFPYTEKFRFLILITVKRNFLPCVAPLDFHDRLHCRILGRRDKRHAVRALTLLCNFSLGASDMIRIFHRDKTSVRRNVDRVL